MLVLGRKINQSIIIGDNIEIVVVDIRKDQVKLGIKAPRDVAIYRKEIYEEIKAENIRAMQSKEPPKILQKKINNRHYIHCFLYC